MRAPVQDRADVCTRTGMRTNNCHVAFSRLALDNDFWDFLFPRNGSSQHLMALATTAAFCHWPLENRVPPIVWQ